MHNTFILTGSSGKLGSAIRASGMFHSLLTPSRKEMDIEDQESVVSYLDKVKFDGIIHCAALARMKACEEDPSLAIRVNTIGTAHLVNAIAKKEKTTKKSIRFIHLSTDGVYTSIGGPHKENGPTIPYNLYGWTKLGAECAARTLSNHCIIRTSFFDPKNILFETAATDMFSSRLPISEFVSAIHFLSSSSFIGAINVGEERESDYARYKRFKPSIAPTTFSDIQKSVPFCLAKDSTLDITLWKSLEEKTTKH